MGGQGENRKRKRMMNRKIVVTAFAVVFFFWLLLCRQHLRIPILEMMRSCSTTITTQVNT
jgi:hypothetical protein